MRSNFILRGVDKQHRVEATKLGMAAQHPATIRAVERRESKQAASVMPQDELHAFGAEAAGAVVQKDGASHRLVRRRRHDVRDCLWPQAAEYHPRA
jgi:hypothetical protein